MLKLDSYDMVARGYYLVKVCKKTESNSPFEIPDVETGDLSVGEIILSGETVIIVDTEFDLEFNPKDIVAFKLKTGVTVYINEEKHMLLPYDSVIMKIKDSNNE